MPIKLPFEHRAQPLLPGHLYFLRILFSIGIGFTIIAISLFIGMSGYHWFEHLTWIDSFVNAAMLLSGMGPLEQPQTDAGKFFAGCYALYSGLAVILVAGIMFAPVIHRFLHKFHLEKGNDD